MAALNFPSSPTNLQVHTENGRTYQYYSSSSSWVNISPTISGYTGSFGYTGSASTVVGYTGSKGDIGYSGSRGYTGSAGTFSGTTTSQIITTNSTPSSGFGSGALQVTGGGAIGGNFFVGGYIDSGTYKYGTIGNASRITISGSGTNRTPFVLYTDDYYGSSMDGFSLQPQLAEVSAAYAQAISGGTTVSAHGIAISGTGTATSATTSNTSFYTYVPKVEYLVTTASTTAVAGFRGGVNQYGMGGGGLIAAQTYGGFLYICKFGISTGVSNTNKRCFVGMRASTSAPTDVSPNSLTNIFGVGYDSGDSNWQIYLTGGTSLSTRGVASYDTGIPIPTTDRELMYTLQIYMPSGDWTNINSVSDSNVIISLYPSFFNGQPNSTYGGFTNSAFNITGSVVNSTTFPTVMMNPYAYTSVGGTSAVTGIALSSLYAHTL